MHRHALSSLLLGTRAEDDRRCGSTIVWCRQVPGSTFARLSTAQAHAVFDGVEVSCSSCRGVVPDGCPGRRLPNTSRSFSPTSSTMPWKSSSRAMPCWMLLITASSALRCLGLLQQALRLVEQARVLERHAHARPPMVCSSRICDFAEGVLALVVLEHDHAQHAVAADDRHDDDRQGPVGARHCAADASGDLLGVRVDDTRLRALRAAESRCPSARRRRRHARGARRARTRTGKCSRSASSSHQRMLMSPVSNTSRSLSPTRSTMAWKSSFAAMPCWMLLISASSPARCSSSPVRSATFCSRLRAQRALSSATAAWLASMARRSRSLSWKRPNAPSMST